MRTRLKATVFIEVHDNTHTMVSYRRNRRTWKLRLHHMFLAGSERVLDALANFVRSPDTKNSAELDHYIERNRALIRRVPPEQLQKRLRMVTDGRHHDLRQIFAHLNRRYFRSRIRAAITYGSVPPIRRARKSIKMGSYSAESRVIRIHPALDQAEVPRYFVEWIVFHEMLHDVYRVRRRGGRRCVHPPEFLRHERRFHAFHRARRWEDENLDLLLTAPGFSATDSSVSG